MTRQPAVYPFIGHLARRLGCATIVDLGLGDPAGLATLSGEFEIIGLGRRNVARVRERLPSAELLDWDGAAALPVELEGAALICSVGEGREHSAIP